jgi:hypothetical protein
MNNKNDGQLHVEIESFGIYTHLNACGDPERVAEFLSKLNADEYIGPVTSVSSALISAVKAAQTAREDKTLESSDGQ